MTGVRLSRNPLAPFGAVLVGVFVLVPCVVAESPLGYHRRVEGGWTLLAISTPMDGYTACALDPAPGAPETEFPEGALLERELDGHRVVRADGLDADAAIRAVLGGAPSPSAAASASERFVETERHLLVLAGLRWAEITNVEGPVDRSRPVLILAGREDPSALMANLLAAVDELPDPPAPDPDRPAASDTEPALSGWWRHLERPSTQHVSLGLLVVQPELEQVSAVRVALRALHHRLTTYRPAARTDVIPSRAGLVYFVTWDAPPDSAAILRRHSLEVLEALRAEPLPAREFLSHREFLKEQDAIAVRRVDRWFENILLGELDGRIPQSAYRLRDRWESVDLEAVRDAFLTLLPRDVITVSSGILGAAAGGDETPTERWASEATLLTSLSPEDRTTLRDQALARTAWAMWGLTPPEGIIVESTWVLGRGGAPLSGRLEETFRAGDGLRRDFYPEEAELSFTSLLVDGEVRREVLGHDRPPDSADGERVRSRHRSDPFQILIRTLTGDDRVIYAGGTPEGRRVFQRIEIEGQDGLTLLDLDPRDGLPARVTLGDPEKLGSPLEFRHRDYSSNGDLRYPSTIERYRGGRREALLTVKRVVRCSRLAATERLQ